MSVIDPNRTTDQQRHPRRRRHLRLWLCYLGGLCLVVGVNLGLPWRRPLPAMAADQGQNDDAHVAADVAPGCLNLVSGGNFEQFDPNWEILASARPPMYSNEQTFNGSLQSLRLGNGVELPNVESVSEVRHKPILLPFGATRIILRFLHFPAYEDAPGADLQQADLFDATTDQLIGSLLNSQDNARVWKARDFDLTLYAGRTISLRFRVRNDGTGGRSFMYIDNVELEYCAQAPLPTFTTTLTPSPSTTPLPTTPVTSLPQPTTPVAATLTPIPVTSTPVPPEDLSCPNILVNGGFEGYDGWYFGEDPVPPRYISDFVQEGVRAVLLGNPPENPTDVVTFSSVRQLVTLPFTNGPIQLRWWRLLRTAQAGAPTGASDRQDLILLAPNLKPIQILRRELRNDGIWQEDAVNLTSYRGQTLYLYFNAFNDGNNARTWLYLDNVRLRVCGAPVVAPTVMVTAIPGTPIAIPLTPMGTYVGIPTPGLLSLPSLTVVAPLPTDTPIPLLAPIDTPITLATLPIVPTDTLFPTPTSNVYALPTLPTQAVVGSPTAFTASEPTVSALAPALSATDTPLPLNPISVASQRPQWADRLGAIAVLTAILVVIGFVVVAIVRLFQRQP